MLALFINSGGIGDQILLLPAVKLLKEKYPDSDIDLISEPRSACIREVTNLFRKVKEFDFKAQNPNLLELRELIKQRFYKYLICTGSSYKANLVASLGNAEIKIGYYKGIFSKLFLTNGVKLNKNQYTANMFAELLIPIMPEVATIIEKKELIPEIKLNMEVINWAKEVLNPRIKERYYAKKIFIHPGVSKLSTQKKILKAWSSKNWATLIEKLIERQNNTVILLGGKDDIETISDINKRLTFYARPDNFFDLSSLELSLDKLGALIHLSDLLVCVDSAPMHLAVALGKKLVAYFQATDPKKLLPKDSRFIPIQADTGTSNSEVTPYTMLDAINKQLT